MEGRKLKVMLELIDSPMNMEASLMDPPGSIAKACLISRGQGRTCLTSPHGRVMWHQHCGLQDWAPGILARYKEGYLQKGSARQRETQEQLGGIFFRFTVRPATDTQWIPPTSRSHFSSRKR